MENGHTTGWVSSRTATLAAVSSGVDGRRIASFASVSVTTTNEWRSCHLIPPTTNEMAFVPNLTTFYHLRPPTTNDSFSLCFVWGPSWPRNLVINAGCYPERLVPKWFCVRTCAVRVYVLALPSTGAAARSEVGTGCDQSLGL
jgi:hypothetical protein